MILRSYRIVKERHAAVAFDGDGARLAGGRWNSPGVPMIYTAGSLALAALEILVHLDRAVALPGYVYFTCSFDDTLVADAADLPPTLPRYVNGDAWIDSRMSPVLRVPSAVIPEESNYLLNPQHPGFPRIEISPPRSFRFDSRLFA